MIFRRLQSSGAEWVYHFPEIGIVDLTAFGTEDEPQTGYSPSRTVAAELSARQRNGEKDRVRVELAQDNARARQDALDRLPPTTVRAYRQVYERDPRGWPPA
jgi:hypothetical protein